MPRVLPFKNRQYPLRDSMYLHRDISTKMNALSPRCRLLELPAELRIQVWSHVVVWQKDIPLDKFFIVLNLRRIPPISALL